MPGRSLGGQDDDLPVFATDLAFFTEHPDMASWQKWAPMFRGVFVRPGVEQEGRVCARPAARETEPLHA